VAQQLAAALESANCDYAIGGAIALGFWADPRGTLDVDVTLFLSPNESTNCCRLLQRIGCTLEIKTATATLREHGYCEVEFCGIRLDVFLPSIDFYERARQRRKQVQLGARLVTIWDAETLCVFKMMFFRRKDLADVEQVLRAQSDRLDRDWILEQLIEIYGQRDPRISQWVELARETQP
jgi:hypothetical protein